MSVCAPNGDESLVDCQHVADLGNAVRGILVISAGANFIVV